MRPVHRLGPARAAPGRDGGQGQGARGILAEPLAQLQAQVEYPSDQLIAGVREGRYVAEPWLLFEVRIALAEAAQQAVQLELQASGGAAYLKPAGDGFARRWREAAFLPIVTPSLVQLKTELAKRRAGWPPRRRHERRHERPRAGAARARSDAALSGRRRRRVPGREPDLARGEVLAVLGASGAGKSSLLRVLAGLQAPSAGALDMEGQRLAGVHPRVAVAFQDPGLLPWLTLERNVAFGLDFKHQPALDARERARRVDLAIEEVGLSHARQLRPAQLSGGMAQRTALARCLARQPAVLLLDEPFGALDEVTRAEMQTLLRKVVADVGAAALLITHDIDEALLLADRMVLLGGAPGGVLGEWAVDLPQPRADLLLEMGALRLEILSRLRGALRPDARRPNRRYLFDPHQSKTQGA